VEGDRWSRRGRKERKDRGDQKNSLALAETIKRETIVARRASVGKGDGNKNTITWVRAQERLTDEEDVVPGDVGERHGTAKAQHKGEERVKHKKR